MNDSIKTIYGFGGMANSTKRQNFVKLHLTYIFVQRTQLLHVIPFVRWVLNHHSTGAEK